MTPRAEVIYKAILNKPAEAIKQLRGFLDISQEKLASQLNISHSTVYAHERGVNKPYPLIAEKYAEFFDENLEEDVLLQYPLGPEDVETLGDPGETEGLEKTLDIPMDSE